MKKLLSKSFMTLSLGGLLFSVIGNTAQAAIEPDADIAYLRKNCTEEGVRIANCVTKASAVMGWLGTRQPTSNSPATVEIGPGKFSPGFSCNGISNFSLKGSGRGKTVLGGGFGQLAFQARDCFNLHIQDLTITGGFPAPIYWLGGGSSTWVNVEILGGIYGWTEADCSGLTQKPVHHWFSSTIKANQKVAYNAMCSENWFYGSEFITTGSGFSGGIRGITAHKTTDGLSPEVHIYGSVIRVIPDPGITFATPSGAADATGIVAVSAGRDAEVHIHGTGIDVIGNDIPNDIAALAVADGGIIHATQSAFVMKTPSPGKVYRIKNDGGIVKAPYLWENGVLLKNLVSDDGADRTTEIVGGMPHPMVYTSGCNINGPWFDTVTGQCRQ